MLKVLKISASQYSGSTLLTFLLNTHPEITTVGHTGGWHFPEGEEFFCSCGETLAECPFYTAIGEEFRAQGLPFSIRDFGTHYKLSERPRLNRMLTGAIPLLQNSQLERLRDSVVRRTPVLAARLAAQDAANITFIKTALRLNQAHIFLDNAHNPYRLRHLSRNPELEVRHLHLVRDPRGSVLSSMRHAGWDAALGIKVWLRRQADITRISLEYPNTIVLYYEDVCGGTADALNGIYAQLGITEAGFGGDFKYGVHHILGNDMRLQKGEIKPDRRWHTELQKSDRQIIESNAASFAQRLPAHPLSPIIEHYLERGAGDVRSS